jgi:hypothetical protein|tara:strand:+ start:51 stop:257 length:207 start_codon:yes stop_codon:yes gene_type:complete
MTEKQVMQNIVELAATQRDEGGSGQEFVATSIFAIASVCAASDFPRDEVQSLATEAVKQAYGTEDKVE